jgi:hypothetical protein
MDWQPDIYEPQSHDAAMEAEYETGFCAGKEGK